MFGSFEANCAISSWSIGNYHLSKFHSMINTKCSLLKVPLFQVSSKATHITLLHSSNFTQLGTSSHCPNRNLVSICFVIKTLAISYVSDNLKAQRSIFTRISETGHFIFVIGISGYLAIKSLVIVAVHLFGQSRNVSVVCVP